MSAEDADRRKLLASRLKEAYSQMSADQKAAAALSASAASKAVAKKRKHERKKAQAGSVTHAGPVTIGIKTQIPVRSRAVTPNGSVEQTYSSGEQMTAVNGHSEPSTVVQLATSEEVTEAQRFLKQAVQDLDVWKKQLEEIPELPSRSDVEGWTSGLRKGKAAISGRSKENDPGHPTYLTPLQECESVGISFLPTKYCARCGVVLPDCACAVVEYARTGKNPNKKKKSRKSRAEESEGMDTAGSSGSPKVASAAVAADGDEYVEGIDPNGLVSSFGQSGQSGDRYDGVEQDDEAAEGDPQHDQYDQSTDPALAQDPRQKTSSCFSFLN